MSALSLNLVQTLRALAELRRGEFHEAPALAWFDGFWDFFVPARSALERAPGASATGAIDGRSFCILAWLPAVPPRTPPLTRLDLFVEHKDLRPEARAPWPVTTLALDGGGRLESGRFESRPCDAESAATMVGLGASVQLGYWGPHVVFRGVPELDVRALDRLLAVTARLGSSG